MYLPVSHNRLLSSKILIKHRVDGSACCLKSIFVQVERIEYSVVQADWDNNYSTLTKAKTFLNIIIFL